MALQRNHRFFETKDRVLAVNNWISTTVSWIFVIFQYVIADIILYLKSISSAETVKFWTITSSERETPAKKRHNFWINPIFSSFCIKTEIKWYKKLKVPLMSCFVCCCLFPKEYISKLNLLLLWHVGYTVTKFHKFLFEKNFILWRI